jgi:anti-sigma-K factor RskA
MRNIAINEIETHRLVHAMSANKHVTEELAAYALGALDQDEAAGVSRHLADCALCRAELRAYETVVEVLPSAAPAASPSHEVKSRLMARIGGQRAAPAAVLSRRERLRRWGQRPTPAWQLGLVSVLLVIVVALFLLTGLGGQDDFSQIALAATENAPGAAGILIISGDGEYGSLIVQRLPVLNPDQQYQLWLIDDGQRTSGGVFSVHHGYAAIEIYAPRPLSSYQAFGITVEPAGGSPGPTGVKVLGSS